MSHRMKATPEEARLHFDRNRNWVQPHRRMDPQQQPPPYSPGPDTSAPYPTKPGGCPPMQAGTPMQPGYPANPGYPPKPGYPVNPSYVGNSGYPSNSNPGVTTTTTTTRTVVQQQPPAVILHTGFGEVPVSTQCPTCNTQIVTATEYAPGTLSWLACCGLASMGCVLGCCFIPFCIDDMKDVTHKCPNCKIILGIYRKL